MRLLPVLAAAAIGMFATAAVAQNMNTSDPNSAPMASPTGKGKAMTTGQAAMDPAAKANTKDPNSTPDMMKKPMKKKMSKKHSKKMMKKDM